MKPQTYNKPWTEREHNILLSFMDGKRLKREVYELVKSKLPDRNEPAIFNRMCVLVSRNNRKNNKDRISKNTPPEGVDLCLWEGARILTDNFRYIDTFDHIGLFAHQSRQIRWRRGSPSKSVSSSWL